MAEARYDAAADFYVRDFDVVGDPASEALLDLVGPPAGLRILDLACGHGRITRALARSGGQLTGLDISGALIGKARQLEQAQPLRIQYVHADVTRPGWQGPAGFDAITCNFGLSDIDAITTKACGPLRLPCRPCVARSARTTGRSPLTSTLCASMGWTLTSSASRSRRSSGAPGPTVAPSSWPPVISRPLPSAPDSDIS